MPDQEKEACKISKRTGRSRTQDTEKFFSYLRFTEKFLLLTVIKLNIIRLFILIEDPKIHLKLLFFHHNIASTLRFMPALYGTLTSMKNKKRKLKSHKISVFGFAESWTKDIIYPAKSLSQLTGCLSIKESTSA